MIKRHVAVAVLFCLAWGGTEWWNVALAENPVVCFGDSITKRGYPKVLGKLIGVEAVNAGVAGNTSLRDLTVAR